MKQSDRFCRICFSLIRNRCFYFFVNKNPSICDRCMEKISAKFHYFDVDGHKALAIFDYDNELKRLIYQFKGCFDIELKEAFLERYRNELRLMYKGYILIPAPSFEEENNIREFNHVEEIFKQLDLDMHSCIKKVTPFKQAEHKSLERNEIEKHLAIINGEKLKNKKILLVDDVFTTGSTIKAMIKLVKPFNPKKIEVLVISKTILKTLDT